jgi:glycosyltransferase involved in cell wall biosynthesis
LQFLHNTGPHIGGVEQCAINYSNALISDPNNKIYTLIPNANVSYKQNLNGVVIEVNIKNKIKLFFDIIRAVKQAQPDFVIMHCSRALKIFKVISYFKKFTIIGVNHGFNLKKFVQNADVIFCINKTQISQTREIVKNKNIEIAYFPNITPIKENFDHKNNINSGRKITIGTLSRIDFEYKNLDKIVLAAKIMKEKGMGFEFHIGGDFGEIEKLRKMVGDYSLDSNFVFKGFIKDKDKFFNEIDIFCMPSKNETFGISYIEAMARGVPVIATNNDGAIDIITDKESGLLIDKNNPDQLPDLIVGAVDFLIENPDITSQIIKNAFLKVGDDYSFDAMKRRFGDILQTFNANQIK